MTQPERPYYVGLCAASTCDDKATTFIEGNTPVCSKCKNRYTTYGTIELKDTQSIFSDRSRKDASPERVRELKKLYRKNKNEFLRQLREKTIEPVHEESYWQELCSACGHTRYNHTGFREPGCTYLGTCTCDQFTQAD